MLIGNPVLGAEVFRARSGIVKTPEGQLWAFIILMERCGQVVKIGHGLKWTVTGKV